MGAIIAMSLLAVLILLETSAVLVKMASLVMGLLVWILMSAQKMGAIIAMSLEAVLILMETLLVLVKMVILVMGSLVKVCIY